MRLWGIAVFIPCLEVGFVRATQRNVTGHFLPSGEGERANSGNLVVRKKSGGMNNIQNLSQNIFMHEHRGVPGFAQYE
jgi:hypothetical protein